MWILDVIRRMRADRRMRRAMVRALMGEEKETEETR